MSRITKKQSLEGITNLKSSKKIGNNTFELTYNNGVKAIRLHKTNIITFKNNGDIVLNSGGWHTITTKDRLNTHCQFWLIQKNHIWYVKTDKGQFVYYDNIVFDNQGNLKSEKIGVNTNLVDNIKKDIKKYVNLLDKIELPQSNGGDCWYCLFSDKTTGQTWGDTSKSDHLKNHIKENYIFGAILVNSMRENGYRDFQIGFHYQINAKNTFKRALTKYLYKRLLKG